MENYVDIDAIKVEIFEYICEFFDVEDIENETPLFSSNIIDSFGMVELVVFIEEKSGLRVETLDYHLDNLDSIDKIMAFISRKKS